MNSNESLIVAWCCRRGNWNWADWKRWLKQSWLKLPTELNMGRIGVPFLCTLSRPYTIGVDAAVGRVLA